MTWPVSEEGGLDYRSLFEAGADGMLLVSGDGTVLDANPEACRVLRRRREDIVAGGMEGVLDPSDPRVELALEEQRRTGRFGGMLRLLRRDGVSLSAEVWITAHRDKGGGFGMIFREVTEREQLERALRESEGWFGKLVGNAPDLVVVMEAGGAVKYASPSIERVLGYRPEEFAEKAAELLHPDDRDGARDVLTEAAGRPGVRVRHEDGSWRYLEGYVTNLLDDPDVKGLVFIGRDTTERVRAEEEIKRLNEQLEDGVREHTRRLEIARAELEENGRMLRESEDRFRATFDLAATGIAHVGLDGRWLRVNQKLCEIVGHSREELLSKTLQGITHSDDLEQVHELLESKVETYSIEKRCVRKDRSQVWVNLTVSLVCEPSGGPKYFIAFVEETTDRRDRERLLRSLTPRETEVLWLLVKGCTNREIAERMAFSVGTAKTDVGRIIGKLQVSDRTQAAVRAVELGLVSEQ